MVAKSILLVKTSSLGDVIHALPAISDIKSVSAGGRVDWVVEEPLLTIPRLHAGVSGVIPVAIRRWRRALWRGSVRDEIAAGVRRLREQSYDAVIDAQGLFKSALIALAARGTRYGLDFRSSREPLALLYHHTFRVSWELHAVERNRLLLARALCYEVPRRLSYGISAAPRRFDWLAAGPYAVLLHATSGDYKLWPERNWVELGNKLNDGGMCCVLPWGNARERERASRIADGVRSMVVAPALGLEDFPGLFAGAQAVAGVDTGLTHLAAALGVPTVGIYCATDPAATGIYGCARAVNVGGIGQSPAVNDVVKMLEQLIS
ncbi:MAG: lipopolysaccharide heptosyltransferase I [Betaproteobacteria bacterium]|nr:lipopolysaccharide heptosyltransferase I [Betaproteobacteria bacterium]